MSHTPPGWYTEPNGTTRYWDGQQWSEPYRQPTEVGHPLPVSPTTHAAAPVKYANLRTDRSLLAFILLNLITLGFYGIWLIASSGEDLNTIAGRHDDQRTMNYWLVFFIIGPLTLGIASIVWWHKTSNRIGNNLRARGQQSSFSAADFWLWSVLGSLIIIGPFVFIYKWLSGMNLLSQDFNHRG